jgi:hypothetical protein
MDEFWTESVFASQIENATLIIRVWHIVAILASTVFFFTVRELSNVILASFFKRRSATYAQQCLWLNRYAKSSIENNCIMCNTE